MGQPRRPYFALLCPSSSFVQAQVFENTGLTTAEAHDGLCFSCTPAQSHGIWGCLKEGGGETESSRLASDI